MTALRPYLPDDSAELARLFRDAVEILAAEDYDDDQRLAWASTADDEEIFAERLARALTIVAVEEGEAVGFASLKDGRVIEMLYVRPDVAREGVGTALVDALEKLAAARGASEIEVAA
ncbi:MAG: GNAT family N-acetyltransferase, partial [Hyphomicrobiales bacterium]|nr:GNAT family N-acetyltransferase [Hyphomicrobiales bacterium]